MRVAARRRMQHGMQRFSRTVPHRPQYLISIHQSISSPLPQSTNRLLSTSSFVVAVTGRRTGMAGRSGGLRKASLPIQASIFLEMLVQKDGVINLKKIHRIIRMIKPDFISKKPRSGKIEGQKPHVVTGRVQLYPNWDPDQSRRTAVGSFSPMTRTLWQNSSNFFLPEILKVQS